MKMYATPVDGTYTYKQPNYDGTFQHSQVSVSVIGESDKQYLIRLLLPVGNHRRNDQLRVRKHNVRIHRPEPVLPDYSGAWWHD